MDQDFDSIGLSAFLAVCSTKNFTRAAALLHITQPALSQRIRRFEDAVGTPLIFRSQPNITLTNAGHEVLAYGRKKRVLLDDLRLKLKSYTKHSLLSGLLRIGSFGSVLRSVIMPVLADFYRKNHDVTVEYCAKEVRELPEMLMRGAIDVAIVDHEISQSGLRKIYLGEEMYVLIESQSHLSPDIYLDNDHNDQTTMRFLQNAGRSPNVQRSYCDDIYGIIDGVHLGLGKAVVPIHLVQQINGLRVIEDVKPLLSPVIAHVHEQDFEGLFFQKVISELQKGCQELLRASKKNYG